MSLFTLKFQKLFKIFNIFNEFYILFSKLFIYLCDVISSFGVSVTITNIRISCIKPFGKGDNIPIVIVGYRVGRFDLFLWIKEDVDSRRFGLMFITSTTIIKHISYFNTIVSIFFRIFCIISCVKHSKAKLFCNTRFAISISWVG